jgi:hypothetical protein
MGRRTFDVLMSGVGLVLAVVLIIAGALLLYAHIYVGNQVYNQLAQQQVFFPPAGSPAIAAPEFAAMRQYAGQQLTTGAQAQVYADHFIANHRKEIGGGKTYSQLSAEAMTMPNNAKLAGQVDTLFRGETLRGLLLNAYAFGKMGTIALWAAIVSFVGGLVFLLLGLLGLSHSRRSSDDQEILGGDRGSNGKAKTPDEPAPAQT